MGNSLNGASMFNDEMNFPYHVQLGSHAFIDVTKPNNKTNYKDDKLPNVTKVAYTVDQSSICELKFKRSFGKVCKMAAFTLHHGDFNSTAQINFIIQKAETEHLEIPNGINFSQENSKDMTCFIWTNEANRTINTWGGVTESSIFLFGKERRGNLVVVEYKKKNKDDQKPYMMTVAHYLAVEDGNFFNQTIDIGLSVIIKIQASNDVGLKFTVEGPERHPSAALFYMFCEVRKNGVWKTSLCPHCVNIQKQRARMSWETSESEDNDNFLPQKGYHLKANTRSVLANDAPVKGNYNGSLFVRKLNFLR